MLAVDGDPLLGHGVHGAGGGEVSSGCGGDGDGEARPCYVHRREPREEQHFGTRKCHTLRRRVLFPVGACIEIG